MVRRELHHQRKAAEAANPSPKPPPPAPTRPKRRYADDKLPHRLRKRIGSRVNEEVKRVKKRDHERRLKIFKEWKNDQKNYNRWCLHRRAEDLFADDERRHKEILTTLDDQDRAHVKYVRDAVVEYARVHSCKCFTLVADCSQ
jgi:hypothetical protein